MPKRKSRGNNNRGGPKSHSRGGSFGRGRGRGDPPPADFDIFDFPVQMWPGHDSHQPFVTPRGRGWGYRERGANRGSRGYAPPRTNTPSRGNPALESRSSASSRGNGTFQSRANTPSRGIGGGHGHPGIGLSPQPARKSKLGSSAPLSSLLYESRPLLRPIVFVKSSATPVLFQQEEELLQPAVEEIDDAEENRIPTADRIAQVIGGLDLESDEEIEEIDFNDTERLLEVQAKPGRISRMAMEEQFTGYYQRITHSAAPLVGSEQEGQIIELSSANVVEGMADITINSQPENPSDSLHEAEDIMPVATGGAGAESSVGESESSVGFFIDTTPSQIVASSQATTASHVLGALDDDEDIIVYVPPHPRSGRLTPVSTSNTNIPTKLSTTSMLTGLSTIHEPPLSPPSTNAENERVEDTNIPEPAPPASNFAAVKRPRQFVSPLLLASPSTQRKAKLRVRMQESRYARQKKWNKRSMFSFAAERQDKEWEGLDGPDPRWEDRRRGDSDVDWGDEEGERAAEPLTGLDGMNVDPELLDEKSIGALGSFADGMLGQEGSRHLTMDDIADIEKLKQEDEASEGGAEGSSEDEGGAADEQDSDEESEEVNAQFEIEEERMVGETAEQSDEDEESEDEEDELSSCSSFRQRLEFIRKLPTKRSAKNSRQLDEGEAEFDEGYAWESDDYINRIQDLVDGAEDIMTSRDRKERKWLFKAINNGDYEDLSTFTVARRKKDKPTHLPPELQEQWAKDRAKKAVKKAERELAKLEAAADPLVKKKGGKKGRKAMLAAARQDPQITVIGPNRVIDMTTLVQQIKRFIANPDGPPTMVLPPTGRETRKLVHEVAAAFNLKSKSNGHGDARYTTLIRRSRSGLRVDEARVARIVRGGHGGEFYRGDGKVKAKGTLAKQREGEEVGKAAPKIDSSNRGFRLLEAMGWSEGKQIGISGGLDQPLMAIIKHSKLGLGATRQIKG